MNLSLSLLANRDYFLIAQNNCHLNCICCTPCTQHVTLNAACNCPMANADALEERDQPRNLTNSSIAFVQQLHRDCNNEQCHFRSNSVLASNAYMNVHQHMNTASSVSCMIL